MEVIGIIAEYNPFHNGHVYHINKIKERYPDSLIIAIVNGYFVMRGSASILSKEDKTKLCLEHNTDIVISLPYFYGSQSADYFAYGAIKILNEFHITKLVFGSESNDINLLKHLANKKVNELKPNLSLAANYNNPKNPNDILGISYIKAINKINKNIIPETIQRTNNYHDNISDNIIISASNIREKILNNIDVKKHIPTYNNITFKQINNKKIFDLLKYKILYTFDLDIYVGIDQGLSNKIKKNILKVNSIDELIQKVKSKRYSYISINRMLNHILVDFKKEDNLLENLDYIQILGFNNSGQKYLKQFDFINNNNSLIKKYELLSANIYQMITETNVMSFEEKNKPIIKAK